ncbi:hypothetical protein FKP32DRAFT_1670987 [Trametes sanguinea]|nr:hypothetical protein FKP32DRAFT_1670987 [Trametes sanguinea]
MLLRSDIPLLYRRTGRFITVLEVLPYIIWAAFSSLRAYALSGRTLLIGLVVFVLSLVPAGVNAYFFSTFTFVNLPPPSDCTALSSITADLSRTRTSLACYIGTPLTIVSRSSLMAADAMVIVVTWASTYRLRKATRDVGLGTSFGTLLLRDGTIYFVVLVAMNIVHLVLNTVNPNNFVQQASYVTVLENPITSVLISRFILNLRAVDHRGGGGGGGGGERTGERADTLYSAPSESSPSFVRTFPSPSPCPPSSNPGGRGRAEETTTTLQFASRLVDEFDGPLGFGLVGGEEWAGSGSGVGLGVGEEEGGTKEGEGFEMTEESGGAGADDPARGDPEKGLGAPSSLSHCGSQG